jgi:putative methyltransferase (TIGR04325 family)
MASTAEIYATALQHHRAGEIDRAAGLYREILRVDPAHADATHLLGVAAHQREQHGEAVEYITRAISLNPSAPAYHSNLGAACRALGLLDRAVESLCRAVGLDANYAEGYQNLGILLGELGRHEESRQALARAQQLRRAADPEAVPAADYIWQGIYRGFDEVPVRGSGHEGDRWAQATLAENRQIREALKSYRNIPFQTFGHHALLPLLAGIVAQEQPVVRILDFGGATGTAWLHLTAGTVDVSAVELHVVETEVACRLGEQLWADEPRVRFHRAVADVPPGIDIVHVNSALQYIEDYRGLLEVLCGCGARYFLLPRLSAGDFPTYATAQMNLWGDVVAYWFLNVGELVGIFESCGYRLLSKSVEPTVYDQSNFPPEYRMHRACNLLFGLATK